MPVLATLVLLCPPCPGAQEVEIDGRTPVWLEQDGKTYTRATLPEAVDHRSVEVVDRWLGCLGASHAVYTAEVLRDGWVFVLAPEIVDFAKRPRERSTNRADHRRRLERARREREKREARRKAREGPPPSPEELRREHLLAVLAALDEKLPAPADRQPATTPWGLNTLRNRRALPVLLFVRDRHDFHRVVDAVLAANPDSRTQIERLKAEAINGAFFEDPLVGVVIQEPEDLEDYEPHHELAKKLVEIVLFQRFGPQPFFVREGLGWTFEWAEFREIRTFTGRAQFLVEGDEAYDGWPMARVAAFRPGEGLCVESDLELLAALREWRSDTYRGDLAAASYQLARCLVDRHLPELREVLSRWGAATADRRGRGDRSSWSLDPEFVLSAEELVAGLGGLGVLEAVREYER